MGTFYTAEQIESAKQNRGFKYRVVDLLHDIMTREIPLDAEIWYERIEDKYFDREDGWKAEKFHGVNNELNEFISAFQGFQASSDKKQFLITAHY